jgi:hypothetical protein
MLHVFWFQVLIKIGYALTVKKELHDYSEHKNGEDQKAFKKQQWKEGLNRIENTIILYYLVCALCRLLTLHWLSPLSLWNVKIRLRINFCNYIVRSYEDNSMN